jgi:amino acid adenylation domain-containing protein
MKAKQNQIEDTYPLSPMQQGLLFHSLYAPTAGLYMPQLVGVLQEDLDVPAFEEAWQQVISRHPILRTEFCLGGVDEPFQAVHRRLNLPLHQQDWRGLSLAEQASRLAAFLQEERHQGFELTELGLMRLALFRVAEADYRFVWTAHHALLDGRSTLLVLKELFSFYEALLRGHDLSLKQPRPYRDYIDWLGQQDLTKAENFWRRSLSGFAVPTPLVVDTFQSPQSDNEGHGQQAIHLTESLTSQLQSLAQQHQLTLNTLLQGAWALLLSRYSGETDVVFGATRACRRSTVEGGESMVGLFINTLPVRIGASPEKRLLPWLKELRSQWVAMRDYEHTPLIKIQEWIGIPRATPLFKSILVFEHCQPNASLRALGTGWEKREFHTLQTTNYPLTVVGFGGRELLLGISYERRRFDDATIQRMLGHLQILLTAIAGDPGQCLSELPLLTELERHQLISQWNQTTVEYSQDVCVHHLFEKQARSTPERTALVHGDRQVTYEELNRRSNQLAHYLRKQGVGPETLVAVCMDRSPELVIAIMAILKAGGAYVPLDANYPPDRLQYLLQDSQSKIVISKTEISDRLHLERASEVEVICLDSRRDEICACDASNPHTSVSAANLAYAVYTSGSTGLPKGVLVTHRSLVNYALEVIRTYDIIPADRRLQFVSLSSDVLASEIFPFLLSGAALVFLPRQNMISIAEFLQFIEAEELTVVALPSAYWHEWAASMARGEAKLPPSLRIVTSGMDKVQPELFNLWKEKVRGRIRWFNAYGPAETTVAATRYEADLASQARLARVPIGRPIANMKTYVLDRNRSLVPIGIPGELYIGGHGVARGYLDRPDLTAEKFVPDIFSANPADRLYRTGDLARYLPDGNLEFLGRFDHQVKIRGYRIELGEIETVLNQHPGIQEAVVIAREDVPGNKQLVAYYIAVDPAQAPTGTYLRQLLQERVPEYSVPSAFILLSRLPLTPNGKVDRGALPLPHQERSEVQRSVTAPQDMFEIQLTKLWGKLLGLPSLGTNENFFELGGNSLLAVRLFAEIEKITGKKLPLATLFQAPTIEGLATALRQKGWSPPWSSLVAIQPSGFKPPLFCVHGMGGNVLCYYALAQHLGPDQPVYGLQAQGLDGKQVSYTGIEEMAAYYVEQMRAVQSSGPYFLGGISYGGSVAFTMAQQLCAQGDKVGLVALLDTLGPHIKHQPLNQRASAHLRALVQLRPEQKLVYMRERLHKRMKSTARLIEKIPIMPHRALKHPLPRTHSKAGVLSNREAQSKDAWRVRYAPGQPYLGRVTLFRARQQLMGVSKDDLSLGWSGVIADLNIREVPGDHTGIIAEPNVRVLAEQLRNCLEEAGRG